MIIPDGFKQFTIYFTGIAVVIGILFLILSYVVSIELFFAAIGFLMVYFVVGHLGILLVAYIVYDIKSLL